ncbi:hypothetical protein D3C85_527500 [compost metagenome]
MFLTNLILIALLVVYSSRVTNNDYKYEILKEDYTRRILQVERAHDMKVGRIQEQLNSIQFTMDRRFELIDDRRFLEQRK